MHEINQTKRNKEKTKYEKKHRKEKFTYVELLTNFQDATIKKRGCQKLKLAKSSGKS
jgi:hypothetical protein